MSAIEITLLIAGIIVFVVSFVFTSKSDKPDAKAELTQRQREDIENQVLNLVQEQLSDVSEKNEIELDRISNIKMNEMNEYAETILGEINRNHNEVMFLYDMLNEKKKEVNNTVRDLNIARKQLENNEINRDEPEMPKTQEVDKPKTVKKAPKKTTPVKQTAKDTKKDNNDKILELSSKGKSNVEIAKELGLGVGEVKLVVDLFRGGR